MRFKPVPDPPADLEALADVRAAVPADPAAAAECDDCCARVLDRTLLEHRDEAGAWLTFLRALGLAAETPSGFVRTDADLEPAALRTAFRERVHRAEAVLETLEAADEPPDAGAVAGRVRRPSARGSRRDTGERERVERLLAWAVLLDLVEQVDGGYRLGPAAESRPG